ncbi:hypothetical protein AGMMS50268_32230 [Spirochaetia bacterium]|nr:hypothetical protein AGMMS50268_32230 [Spirochaetia bacterium]
MVDLKPFVFVGQYINAPTNHERKSVLLHLRDIIDFIGRKYGTIKGSNFAKAKHYLKREIPGCYGRHIKLMLGSVDNTIIRFHNDAKYVYRLNKKTYAKIFAKIISIMENNLTSLTDDMRRFEKNNVSQSDKKYSELLISDPMYYLKYVTNHGKTPEEMTEALALVEEIQKADRQYTI